MNYVNCIPIHTGKKMEPAQQLWSVVPAFSLQMLFMGISYCRILFYFLLLTVPGYLYAGSGQAAGIFPGGPSCFTSPATGDSLVPVVKIAENNALRALLVDSLLPAGQVETVPEEQVHELSDIEKEYNLDGNNQKTLIRMLRVMSVRNEKHYRKNRQRLFADMAGVAVRLRLYPFAMQCYYQSLRQFEGFYRDDFTANNEGNAAQKKDVLQTSAAELGIDTNTIKNDAGGWKNSKAVSALSILNSFDDKKDAVACALLVHIKQPVAGKRRTFSGLNIVGHMFITLIKYNADRTLVCRSFGFYPGKSNIFSATPIHPAAPGVFKDDAFHKWDEVTGKFISHRRLNKILRLLVKYDGRAYDLNGNNCTDFGLLAAMLGGIDIRDTRGSWPLGGGNTPACAGQSILEGKCSNAETEDKDGLFICTHKNAPLFNALK